MRINVHDIYCTSKGIVSISAKNTTILYCVNSHIYIRGLVTVPSFKRSSKFVFV